VIDGEIVACRWASKLRQAALALDQARHYPPVGIRLARTQRPRPSSAAAGEAPGVPAGAKRFGRPAVLPSETFLDGQALLRAAEEHRLEGVVSKRRDAPYRSGDCRDWRKIKTAAWREANRERWRLFERRRAGAQ